LSSSAQNLIDAAQKSSCPKWVREMNKVPPCPKNGLGLLPESYPSMAIFIGDPRNDSAKIILNSVYKNNPPDRLPLNNLLGTVDFDKNYEYYVEKTTTNSSLYHKIKENTVNGYVASHAGFSDTYLQDGFKATFGASPTIHMMSDRVENEDAGGDLANILKGCGFELAPTLKPHSNPNADRISPENHQMGGNLMSPVPGICAQVGEKPIEEFKKMGCTESNTVMLPSSWGGVNHIDENIAVVPNPKSKKPPPCNFSLVINSPRKTLSLIEAAAKNKSTASKPFFNLAPYGDQKGHPYGAGGYADWSEAPGVKDFCSKIREMNESEYFKMKGENISITNHYKITGNSKNMEDDPVETTEDEKEKVISQFRSKGYAYIDVEKTGFTVNPNNTLTKTQIEEKIKAKSNTSCENISIQDVNIVFQQKKEWMERKQKVLDQFEANLRQKMKETKNECGDGSDLDVIHIADIDNNSIPNMVNLFPTSDQSIVAPDGLVPLFKDDFTRQLEARGIKNDFMPLYERSLNVRHGADSMGFAHCLNNSIKVCKPEANQKKP
jgi:hypothetical protein